jgi:hypothetical protein
MRLMLPFFLAASLLISVRADIVTLIDGTIVEGEVVGETPTDITLRIPTGKTTLKREEIQKIEHRKSAHALMREKMDLLAQSNAAEYAWLKLAAEAKKSGAQDESVEAYKHVLEMDAENVAANQALGRVKLNDHWVEKPESAKSESKPADEKQVAPFQADKSAETPREKLAQMAGVLEFAPAGEQLADCPNCHGTGIAVMLPCLNCNKSGKPGYKNLGDHFEMDQRCGGTGKTVGLYCGLCNRTGKVLLSHVTPAHGGTKAPPAGKEWCPNCNGTGYESWLPCLQCKRSKWPGYLFMGDHLELCNSCNGNAKKPALACSVCKMTGLVPTK